MAAQKVLSICGSLRKGSLNAALVRALPSLAPDGMTITTAPSFAAIPIYNWDEQNDDGWPEPARILAEAIRAADGLIIVSPEYNFSIPGGLKNAIDWISRMQNQPFAGKPVALQSASPGPVGGARMQYHLRMALQGLDAMLLTKPEVFAGHAASKMNEAGELVDETTRGFMRQQLAAFAKFIERVRV
jgi:chromate reductase